MRHTAAALLGLALATACAGRSAAPGTAATTAARPAAASADPTSLGYATGAGRYRWETTGRFVQEVMGSTSDLSLSTSMLLSTLISEESGNLAIAVTVESLTVSGDAPGIDAAALGGAQGRTYRVVLTPVGRHVSLTSPDTGNAAIVQVGRGFRRFLPRLPDGPLAPGTVWADTVTETESLPGGSGQTSTQTVRTYRLVGWETRDGVRSLHLATSGTFAVTGTGEIQGQAIEVTGSGQATADQWVSSAGVYLGGSSRDSTNLTVTVINVGITVPIRQVQQTTITRQQ